MSNDCITLRVPAKPEYILVVRLTTSAVASRIGFGIDEIEDIKVAVAEAAILIMNEYQDLKELSLNLLLNENELIIKLSACDNLTGIDAINKNKNQQDLSFYIIKSLMDKAEFYTESEMLHTITMYKKCGG